MSSFIQKHTQCDRCGYEWIFRIDINDIEDPEKRTKLTNLLDGWGKIGDNLLCPSCMAVYQKEHGLFVRHFLNNPASNERIGTDNG